MTIESSFITSSTPGIPSRNIRVYLPPEYDRKRRAGYPVLYMHDGQNVFAPGTEFGCWYAEEVAEEEISSGRVPPFIIVAIDNDGENRGVEYVPPGNRYKRMNPGCADLYTKFLIDDVIPYVTGKYNITDRRSETVIAGSSLGGVVSLYIGLETGLFGMIGSMSTAICWAENYLDLIAGKSLRPLRIYHDIGTAEPEEMKPDDYDEMPRKLHGVLKKTGYSEPENLYFIIEEGGQHNEAAWNKRLPQMLRWMFG